MDTREIKLFRSSTDVLEPLLIKYGLRPLPNSEELWKYYSFTSSTLPPPEDSVTSVPSLTYPALFYRNETTALGIATISHGTEVYSGLFRLESGWFPSRKSESHWVNLRYLKAFVKPSLKMKYRISLLNKLKYIDGNSSRDIDWNIYAPARLEKLRTALSNVAEVAERCADGPLRGDFSLFDQIAGLSEAEKEKLTNRMLR